MTDTENIIEKRNNNIGNINRDHRIKSLHKKNQLSFGGQSNKSNKSKKGHRKKGSTAKDLAASLGHFEFMVDTPRSNNNNNNNDYQRMGRDKQRKPKNSPNKVQRSKTYEPLTKEIKEFQKQTQQHNRHGSGVRDGDGRVKSHGGQRESTQDQTKTKTTNLSVLLRRDAISPPVTRIEKDAVMFYFVCVCVCVCVAKGVLSYISKYIWLFLFSLLLFMVDIGWNTLGIV